MAGFIIPTLRTDRLILRPLALDDTSPLQIALDDPKVWRYFPLSQVPDLKRTQSYIEGQLSHWNEYGLGHWAVEETDHTLIGWCGLQFLSDTVETEVAYCLGKPFWGKGYATEAAKASLDFGFQELPIKEIIGLTHLANKASQNVLMKIGMKFVDTRRYFGMECYRFRIP